VVGSTWSADFPVTDVSAFRGISDAFIVRYDLADLQNPRLEWATYLGGTGADEARDVAATDDGGAYIVGVTSAEDFPVTTGSCFPDARLGPIPRGFIAKVDASGHVTRAICIIKGGILEGVAIDEAGGGDFTPGVYVVGTADYDGYATPGAYQQHLLGSRDAIVAEYDLDLFSPVYLTYLGGSLADWGMDIAVRNGRAYVAGSTNSRNFPVTPGVLQTAADGYVGFVAAISPTGGGLVFGTYLGGVSQQVRLFGIALDQDGRAIVVGWNAGVYPDYHSRQLQIGRLEPDGQGYSFEFGGTGEIFAKGVTFDDLGRACLTGWTSSGGLATADAPQPVLRGDSDGFVAILDQADQIVFFTYLGGSAADSGDAIARGRGGIIHVAGSTTSSDFPTVSPTQDTSGGFSDAFLVSLAGMDRPALRLQKQLADNNPNNPPVVDQPLTYTIVVNNDGLGAVTGAALTDSLPANAEFVGPSPCSEDSNLHTVSCSLGSIGSGSYASISIVVKPTVTGEMCNSVTLTVAESPDPITVQQCTTVSGPTRDIAFVDHDPATDRDNMKVHRLDDGLLRYTYPLASPAIGLEYDSTGKSLAVIEAGRVTVLNAQNGSLLELYPGAYTAVAFRPSDRRDIAFVKKPPGGTGSYSIVLSFGSAAAFGEQPLLPGILPDQFMGEPRIAWSPDGRRLTAAFTVAEAGGDNWLYFAEWKIPADQLSDHPLYSRHWFRPDWRQDEDAWQRERVRAVANPLITPADLSKFFRFIATNHGFYRVDPITFDQIHSDVPFMVNITQVVLRRIGAVDFDVTWGLAAFINTFPHLGPGGPLPTLGLLDEFGVEDGPAVGITPVAVLARLLMVAVTEPNAVVLYRIVNQPQGALSFERDMAIETQAPRARHPTFRPIAP
ncbi:MAG: SBBP repeat-containing protein, partial [Deltaproteobacteria bacterium]|nr:SBBP repeat-containing protein [Deltaproteobacteria bacterium]